MIQECPMIVDPRLIIWLRDREKWRRKYFTGLRVYSSRSRCGTFPKVTIAIRWSLGGILTPTSVYPVTGADTFYVQRNEQEFFEDPAHSTYLTILVNP